MTVLRSIIGDCKDKAANDEAVKDGSRLLSAYTLTTGKTIWLITEAENDNGCRLATALRREDY